jgi:hypothetical protein
MFRLRILQFKNIVLGIHAFNIDFELNVNKSMNQRLSVFEVNFKKIMELFLFCHIKGRRIQLNQFKTREPKKHQILTGTKYFSDLAQPNTNNIAVLCKTCFTV